MSGDSTRQYRTPGGGTLSLDTRLDNIESKLDVIGEMKYRVDFHHQIFIGVGGAVGLCLIGALLALILRAPPQVTADKPTPTGNQ